MTVKLLTKQLDEQIHARRNLLQGATNPSRMTLATWESAPVPDWSELELHRRFWAEGDALELRLDVSGEPVTRGLVSRDGQFLFGPTGPQWARELAFEIAEEWRSEATEP